MKNLKLLGVYLDPLTLNLLESESERFRPKKNVKSDLVRQAIQEFFSLDVFRKSERLGMKITGLDITDFLISRLDRLQITGDRYSSLFVNTEFFEFSITLEPAFVIDDDFPEEPYIKSLKCISSDLKKIRDCVYIYDVKKILNSLL